MLITHQERPRELKWYHAGPLLYGDLGTSRFYVLGLAFYYALYASLWYVAGVGLLVLAVGWAYTIICRAYPDGGGVYSAARQIAPVLSVIGALLLFADYAVTAALSSYEGFRYFGVHNLNYVALGAIAAILFLGFVNYIGPRHAGTFALLVALATLALTLILAVLAIPHLPEGLAHIKPLHGNASHQWFTLVNVVLALSGVEAVANMTGIMVKPVEKTARKAIWPVLIEVIAFNLLFGVAMLALTPSDAVKSNGERDFARPAAEYDQQVDRLKADLSNARDLAKKQPAYQATVQNLQAELNSLPVKSEHENAVKDAVLRVMGEQFMTSAAGPVAGRIFGTIAGFVFGLLLLSAVNTVLGGMISVQYVMARDGELPKAFAKLNLFGVPWFGLIPAVGIPIILLCIFSELEQLADLYAIGVVGAIAINLSSCTVNRLLPIRTWERLLMGAIAAIMIAIEFTLAYEKPHALIFVLIILAIGLGLRLLTRTFPAMRARAGLPLTPEELARGRYRGIPIAVPLPATALSQPPAVTALGTPAEQLDMSKPHIMVATRGGERLLDFAATYARQLGGILFVVYVRPFNVQFTAATKAVRLEEDTEARGVYEMAAAACLKAGVPMVPIYVVSADVAYSILDFTATYNAQALLMGVSRKGTVLRALQGDVITNVADNLPQDIPLLIHA